MEDGFALNDSVVGILGLGLMGGSLAMNLKGKCARLIGFDPHLPTVRLALAAQAVDHASSDLSSLSQADVLILAAPLHAILDTIPILPRFINKPCILIDLGSTKRVILKAMNLLPGNFEVIGAHPICGKEKSGFQNACATLYQNAPFVVTPSKRTTPRAKAAVRQIISLAGADCIETTAEAHDQALAFTSHLPFLLSSALVGALPDEFAKFVGPGFRSNARLAGSSAHMMLGVLQSNRENILKAIQVFRDSLDKLEENLQSEDYVQMEEMLNRSRFAYQDLIGNFPASDF